MQKIEYDIPIFNNEDVADLNKYSTLMANAIKGQIDKFGNPLIFRGAVQTLADLQALTNVKSGEIYRVDNENKNYVYNGTDWVIYSDNVDLSKYQEEVNTQINEVNEQLTNIEQEGIIVSPTEPTTNRRKVWVQNVGNNEKIYILNDNNVYEEFMKLDNKVDKNTTIAGVNLQDNITANELIAVLKNNIVNLAYPVRLNLYECK